MSPEKQVKFSKMADMVIISGTEGDFGVLPGHAPIVSSIRPGTLEIQDANNIEILFIAGGIVRKYYLIRFLFLPQKFILKKIVQVDE